MSWRTIVISKRCKLDVKMSYMVIRGEEIVRVFLDEIAILMIENPAVSLTGCLLEALTERKIKVIFCDSGRSPIAELVPHHGSHDSTRKMRQQLAWSDATKGMLWRAIVEEKIRKQAAHLANLGLQKEALFLESYIPQIEFQDSTNREGHAAKVYFNALFGKSFSRREENPINAALNYGYSVILSAFNREITAAGYLTQLGVHHDNVFNHFNFSSDLMEPFRILVDRRVRQEMPSELTKEIRYHLIDIVNTQVSIANTNQTVLNAIRMYLNSIFTALNQNDLSGIRFYQL